jgi:hypothetical protein
VIILKTHLFGITIIIFSFVRSQTKDAVSGEAEPQAGSKGRGAGSMDERLSRGDQPCIHLLFRGTRGLFRGTRGLFRGTRGLFRGTRGLFRGKVASDLDSGR